MNGGVTTFNNVSGDAGKVQVVGCVNLTGVPFGTVTETGTVSM